MLRTRVITAVIMVACVLAAIFFLPLKGFMLLAAVIFALAAWEWGDLSGLSSAGRVVFALAVFALLVPFVVTDKSLNPHQILPAFAVGFFWWLLATVFVFSYPRWSGIWQAAVSRLLIGILVLVPSWLAIVYLVGLDKNLFFYLIALVSGADIGAYFAGRAWGKSKLAPKVSPGKSWAGFWGGFFVSIVVAGTAHALSLFSLSLFTLLLISCVTMPASVMGDLFESMLKRNRGIKDSSQLLPGHGGFLDRLDSLTAAAPVFCLLMMTVV